MAIGCIGARSRDFWHYSRFRSICCRRSAPRVCGRRHTALLFRNVDRRANKGDWLAFVLSCKLLICMFGFFLVQQLLFLWPHTLLWAIAAALGFRVSNWKSSLAEPSNCRTGRPAHCFPLVLSPIYPGPVASILTNLVAVALFIAQGIHRIQANRSTSGDSACDCCDDSDQHGDLYVGRWLGRANAKE